MDEERPIKTLRYTKYAILAHEIRRSKPTYGASDLVDNGKLLKIYL